MFIGFIKSVTINYQLLSLISRVSIYVLPIPNFIFKNAENQIISLSYSLLINRTFYSSISKLFFTVLCESTWYVLHLHDEVVLKTLMFMFVIHIINEEFCHIMENLQKKYNKKLLTTEVVWFFLFLRCVSLFP
jgi:hypothetical protein